MNGLRIYGDINLRQKLVNLMGKTTADHVFNAAKTVYHSIVKEYMAREDKKDFNVNFLYFCEYALIKTDTGISLVIVTPFGINNQIDIERRPGVSKTLTSTGDTNVKY